MDNQHKKITGYRDLTQEEIDLMNEGKELAAQCGNFIDKLKAKGATLASAPYHWAKPICSRGLCGLFAALHNQPRFN